jgi:hypothetical protein
MSSLQVLQQNFCTLFPCLSCVLHDPPISSSLISSRNVWWRVQIIELVIIQFSPSSCCVLSQCVQLWSFHATVTSRFPAGTAGELILLFLWSDTWLVSGKPCISQRWVTQLQPGSDRCVQLYQWTHCVILSTLSDTCSVIVSGMRCMLWYLVS